MPRVRAFRIFRNFSFGILELQTVCAKESHCRIKWVLKSTTALIGLMLIIRKILLLGSGFVAKPTLDYLARDPKNHITVGMTP